MSARVELQQPAAISAVHLKSSNNDEQPDEPSDEPLPRSMVQNTTKVIVQLTPEKKGVSDPEAGNAEKLFLEVWALFSFCVYLGSSLSETIRTNEVCRIICMYWLLVIAVFEVVWFKMILLALLVHVQHLIGQSW